MSLDCLVLGLLLLLIEQLVLAHLGQRCQVGGVAVAARAVHVQQDLLIGIDLCQMIIVQVLSCAQIQRTMGHTLRKLRHWYVR